MFDCAQYENCNECCCPVKPLLYNDLSKENKEILFYHRREVEFKAGETIFKQSTAITHIACLREGFVKITAEAHQGKTLLIGISQPGDIFGITGLYVDEIHHSSFQAITDIKVCLLEVNSFKQVLETNIKFSLSLLKRLNQLAIKSKNRTIDLTSKTMYARVADMIIYLSTIIYKSNKFTTTLKRQDLSDFCALSKECMIRILKSYKEDKIISIKGDDFEIHNLNELKKLSQYN